MTDLVVLLAFTGVVILIATWITGAETIEQLSTSLIERTSLRTEGQLQAFFGDVRKKVLTGQAWAAAGILDATDYEAMNKLFVPILKQHPQLSSMMVANSDRTEYLLLRDPLDPHVWSNRIVQADAWGERRSSIAHGTRRRARSMRGLASWTTIPGSGFGMSGRWTPPLPNRCIGRSR